ncbi:hypothetical protein B1H21_14755 [Enterobacter roggenkampii]|nr:hypothetical protein B1H21_14755 [Enterobacter roggenkampii]
MGSCAAPSAKGDDKFITTDYLQQCRIYRACQYHCPLHWPITGYFSAGLAIPSDVCGHLIRIFSIFIPILPASKCSGSASCCQVIWDFG